MLRGVFFFLVLFIRNNKLRNEEGLRQVTTLVMGLYRVWSVKFPMDICKVIKGDMSIFCTIETGAAVAILRF